MIYALQFLAVMASTALADVCWTLYFVSVSEKRAMRAGLWSVLVVAFGAVTAISYIGDNTLLLAAMAGAFAGTALTVRFGARAGAREPSWVACDDCGKPQRVLMTKGDHHGGLKSVCLDRVACNARPSCGETCP